MPSWWQLLNLVSVHTHTCTQTVTRAQKHRVHRSHEWHVCMHALTSRNSVLTCWGNRRGTSQMGPGSKHDPRTDAITLFSPVGPMTYPAPRCMAPDRWSWMGGTCFAHASPACTITAGERPWRDRKPRVVTSIGYETSICCRPDQRCTLHRSQVSRCVPFAPQNPPNMYTAGPVCVSQRQRVLHQKSNGVLQHAMPSQRARPEGCS